MSSSGEAAVQGKAEVVLDRSWRDRAACAGKDTSLWFPSSDEDHWGEAQRAAVAICEGCPVREPCLAYALRHEDDGIWGGTSERWRKRQRKAAGIRLETPQIRTRGRDWVAEERARVEAANADYDLEEAAGW